jgi:galactose mutarotase-like enzyme
MDDLISITSGALTARINPFGAELWSLQDASGAQYMTDADPAFWTGHAPLLFPIVGGLVDDTYRLGDQTYHLPRHGFARRNAFDVLAVEEDVAVFGLSDSGDAQGLSLRLPAGDGVSVERATLHMAATITNAGDHPMPFSFGYHPAFAWPLPGGAAKEAHRSSLRRMSPRISAASTRRSASWCLKNRQAR